MKELAIKFEELAKKYPQWLKDVESKETLLGFTAADFFSFEPFYAELNHLSKDDFKIHFEVDQVPEGDIYQIDIEEGKVAFSRLFCGGEVYYDSFFFYGEKEKWRFQIYTNGVETKPIFVEKVELGEYNEPIKFQRYDQHHYREQLYTNGIEDCVIVAKYFSKTGELYSEEQLNVSFNEGKVASIINETRNKTVFNIEQTENNLNELLEKCHDVLVEKFIAGVEKEKLTKYDICALLIEYNLQHVFPPSIGFAQTKEKDDEFNEDYPPMTWLNAPDMELFFECEFFYDGGDDALYDETNARLDKIEYEEQKEIVFQFYAKLCRTLKTSEKFNSFLNTTDDYFVTACDFEEGNHDKFLDELLPKEQLKQIEDETRVFQQAKIDKLNEDEDYQMVIKTLAKAQKNWSIYEQKLQDLDCKVGYATDLLFSIEPFFIELKRKKPSFDVLTSLSDTPQGDRYYRYKYIDNQIVNIAMFSEGKLVNQTYFNYGDDVIEMVQYYGDPEQTEVTIESFSEFKLEKGKIVSQLKSTDGEGEVNKFTYNEQGVISRIDESRFMYSTLHNMKFDTVEWVVDVLYTEDGNVRRITSTPVGHEKSTVMYSCDDSYVFEAMEDVTTIVTDHLMETFKKNELPKAICFEVDNGFCMPPKVFFKFNEEWTAEHNLYSSLLGNRVLDNNNFRLYVMHDNYKEEGAYFTKTECERYIEQAFQLLCEKMKNDIKDTFGKSIDVIYKGQYQSFESLEDATSGIG